ncbi:shikimate kinase [Neobacillus sp. D3-1R]|uniref:shikimate kinase n=1 Tax=Neobacillus sp. D3-1R TaxID=3445778 RepID=UPI003F9ED4B3
MDRKKLGEKMKAIYLIGFMGSGKTTVGRALSETLGFPVYDTDEEIMGLTGESISAIFEHKGEQYFRSLEKEVLKKLPQLDAIITTGGGIILSEVNREWMKEFGEVIFLYASPEETMCRLEGDETRPLLQSNKKEKVNKMLDDRLPLYLEAASIKVDTTGKSITEIVEAIKQRLKFE